MLCALVGSEHAAGRLLSVVGYRTKSGESSGFVFKITTRLTRSCSLKICCGFSVGFLKLTGNFLLFFRTVFSLKTLLLKSSKQEK